MQKGNFFEKSTKFYLLLPAPEKVVLWIAPVAPKKPEFSLIDEDLLKSRIYTIRGVKVMLDADLAEIYGYSTKDFNRHVKNNIERFVEDFRFQLTKREVEELRSKKFTAITDANISTMSRSNPYVFTEQGIYMLMTVLKGDLAVQQSMALIRLFKQMKDYNAAGNAPDVSAGMVALATQTSLNTRDIAEIATDVRTLSNKVERRYFAPRPAPTVVTTPLWLSCLSSGSDAAPSQDFLFLMQKKQRVYYGRDVQDKRYMRHNNSVHT